MRARRLRERPRGLRRAHFGAGDPAERRTGLTGRSSSILAPGLDTRVGPGVGSGADVRGLLYIGTSGFAYPDWAPRFFPAGLPDRDRLSFYAGRFPAVELNNTFYARPTTERIRAWVAATPPDFRFVVKAQRGAAMRALLSTPAETVPWLTERLDEFGERLGAVLFRVPGNLHRRPDGRSDAALGELLDAWPRTIPLVMEFQDPSWHVDETFAAMRSVRAVLCATDLPEAAEPPTIRRTGDALYLRLRRNDYATEALEAWATRIGPFLDAGLPVFLFFRHDESGRATELATALGALAGGPGRG